MDLRTLIITVVLSLSSGCAIQHVPVEDVPERFKPMVEAVPSGAVMHGTASVTEVWTYSDVVEIPSTFQHVIWAPTKQNATSLNDPRSTRYVEKQPTPSAVSLGNTKEAVDRWPLLETEDDLESVVGSTEICEDRTGKLDACDPMYKCKSVKAGEYCLKRGTTR